MSVDTFISVGAYLVCTMKKVQVPGQRFECSKDPQHFALGETMQYCPLCGGKIIAIPTISDGYLSLYEILQDEGLRADDRDWLMENFSIAYDTGNMVDPDQEIVLPDCNVLLDGDSGGAHEVDFIKACEVCPLDIERLKDILGYTAIEVNTGVLITYG